jgi:hypothetical protein
MAKRNDIALRNHEFRDKAIPKELNPKEFFIFHCKCGNVHFRHAGMLRR